MVSIGPNTQSTNFTHMFDMPDLRGAPKNYVECPNTLMFMLNNNPDFSFFKYLVKLARLDRKLSEAQANYTLFVPSDKVISGINQGLLTNIDMATAKHIVMGLMMNNRITSDILEDSPISLFVTCSPANRLMVTNITGKTYINNTVNVVEKDLLATNGVIHVIDKLIWPTIV